MNDATAPRLADALGATVAVAPVSVVVPCWRCSATIDDAIASVAAQTLPPAEVLLVEDGSGDDTLAQLHRIADAHAPGWIKVIAMPANGGPSRARNAGWEQASQPWIAFLDSDDTWGPRKLELQMAALDGDPDIDLIANRMITCPRGTPLPEVQTPVRTRRMGRLRVLFHNPFPTASVVLRRELPFRFDPQLSHSEDYLLWSQIVFSGHRCARIEQVLSIWNARAAGATGLSDDYAAIHRGRRFLRRKLLQDGLITWPEYLFARMVGVVSRLRREVAELLRRPGASGRAHDDEPGIVESRR